MGNLEHYFENLLYRGQDVNGDVNKNALTADEQKAVEVCAAYVKYTMCGGDAVLLDAILHDNVEPVVRCRNCKHYQFAPERAFGRPVKRCEVTGFEDVEDNDFCSRGARTDGEEREL